MENHAAIDTTRAVGPVMLAIAAAGLATSVAVVAGDRVLAVREHRKPHGQAEALLPLIDAAMREAGLPPAAIETIAVEIGPGSFTGIRAGLAAARGIALVTGSRLAGVTGFEAVVATAPAGPLLVALESRREDLFVQMFDAAREALAAPAAIVPAALAAWVENVAGAMPTAVAGDAAERAAAALRPLPLLLLPANPDPAAVQIAQAARGRRERGAPDLPARPFYLRPPDVTPARREGGR
jgi:tRNA threonylcarbamoyladenosine biosynthesis protein TsaB